VLCSPLQNLHQLAKKAQCKQSMTSKSLSLGARAGAFVSPSDAISPGDTNHIISGSLVIVEIALEHDRSNGPLTLTTGTADISNSFEAGAAATCWGATTNAAAGDLEGRGECAAETRLKSGELSADDAGISLGLDWKDNLIAELGAEVLGAAFIGGQS
jgi:hypothetical protein